MKEPDWKRTAKAHHEELTIAVKALQEIIEDRAESWCYKCKAYRNFKYGMCYDRYCEECGDDWYDQGSHIDVIAERALKKIQELRDTQDGLE